MEYVSTNNAPNAIGPYSQAVKSNGMLFTSGQIAINPETGEMPAGVQAQTAQAIANIKAILAEKGATLDNVVKTTVYLAEMSLFGEMNEIYAQHFTEPFPARSAIAVKELPKRALVEIEVIAAL